MKKTSLILTLLIALALVFTGCPGEGDPNDGKKPGDENPGDNTGKEPGETSGLAEIFSETVLTTAKAKITISGNSITVVPGTDTKRLDADLLTKEGGFDASAYSGIKFEYKTTIQVNVGLQDSGDPNSMWLITDWGAFTDNGDWAEVECVFAEKGALKNAWGSSAAFDKSKWEKLWIGADNPAKDSKFEIRNFEFIK
jgi:hypothetical protein